MRILLIAQASGHWRGLGRLHLPLRLNAAYWGRQFRFGVKGCNPAREHPAIPEIGALARHS